MTKIQIRIKNTQIKRLKISVRKTNKFIVSGLNKKRKLVFDCHRNKMLITRYPSNLQNTFCK